MAKDFPSLIAITFKKVNHISPLGHTEPKVIANYPKAKASFQFIYRRIRIQLNIVKTHLFVENLLYSWALWSMPIIPAIQESKAGLQVQS